MHYAPQKYEAPRQHDSLTHALNVSSKLWKKLVFDDPDGCIIENSAIPLETLFTPGSWFPEENWHRIGCSSFNRLH
jgi:hypothetical protein